MKEPSGSLVGAWNPRCSSRFTFAVSGVSGSDFAYCDVATKGMYSDIVITKIDGILKADKAAAMSQVRAPRCPKYCTHTNICERLLLL